MKNISTLYIMKRLLVSIAIVFISILTVAGQNHSFSLSGKWNFRIDREDKLPDMVYSYCIEVKYAKRDASDTEIEKLLSNAKIQLKQYAASEWIHQDKGTTELKSIALVFQGWKLVRVEEV